MGEQDWLAERFEENRAHLRAVALRMLGSTSEADDAVQESWIRLSRADASSVENLGGWLTTVVARVCLDMLRSRTSRREEPSGERTLGAGDRVDDADDPEYQALLADSVGPALLVVLETLTPGERLAFVLHDLFDVPFDDIAEIVGRSPAAARQLASRARRRVRGSTLPAADPHRQRAIVEAFLAAARDGDFEGLVTLLDPGILLRADDAAVRMGASSEVRGAAAVARVFSGRALGARTAIVDGAVGLVWDPGGRLKVVWRFVVAGDRVVRIDMTADPADLGRFDVASLPG
jgi:RNA polymerase sigma-70 factor (ECF subfamily)